MKLLNFSKIAQRVFQRLIVFVKDVHDLHKFLLRALNCLRLQNVLFVVSFYRLLKIVDVDKLNVKLI